MNKYQIKATSRFKKELKKMKNRKGFDENALNSVVEMLANNEVLPSKYCNHLLEPKSKRYMGMPHQA